ncbi:hypothetical protein ACEPTV_33460, partial [Burkholderia pseudomallei]|uniref:hypothetical protein n=1 Tax=Burkholderia pseudomallei TaxID=28450 RepID=UPI0035902CE3
MTTTPAKPRKPRHGTVRRYKDGCRCDPCTAANTEARRRERERAAKKAGKAVPTTSKRVPTRRPAGPTTARRSTADDELVRVIEDALWDGQGSIAAAALAAEQLRELGY